MPSKNVNTLLIILGGNKFFFMNLFLFYGFVNVVSMLPNHVLVLTVTSLFKMHYISIVATLKVQQQVSVLSASTHSEKILRIVNLRLSSLAVLAKRNERYIFFFFYTTTDLNVYSILFRSITLIYIFISWMTNSPTQL